MKVVYGNGHRPLGRSGLAVDPVLGCPQARADMIVGEVKEGKARLNPALRDPAVLGVVLTPFGCCPADRAQAITGELITRGHVVAPAGHTIRLVAFGDGHGGGDQGPAAHGADGPRRPVPAAILAGAGSRTAEGPSFRHTGCDREVGRGTGQPGVLQRTFTGNLRHSLGAHATVETDALPGRVTHDARVGHQ